MILKHWIQLYMKMRHCALEWNEWKTAQFRKKFNSQRQKKLVDGFDGRLLAIYSPCMKASK